MAGVLGMIGMAVTTFAPSIHIDRRKAMAVGSILIVLLGVTTAMRGSIWGNAIELTAQDIQNSPDDYAAESDAAYRYLASGDFNDAKAYALKSVALFPWGLNYLILGQADAKLGDYPDAANAYNYILQYQNDSGISGIYEYMAELTPVYGDPATNKQFLLNAVNAYPQDSVLWFYLAYFDYRHNDKGAQEAISQAHLYAPSNQIITSLYDTIMNGLPLNVTYKP
jgi:tetratricopeptide (TPR) repeat protein